jgi:minor extracellular serine protease Vpr
MAAAAALLLMGLVVTTAAPVNQEEVQRLHPDRIEQLMQKRSSSSLGAAQVDPALLHSKGTHEVVVRLMSPSAAEHNDAERRQLHKAVLQEEQSAFLKRNDLMSDEISRVQTVLNAVFLTIDASQVASLAKDPDVVSIRRVSNYQMHLGETVPYIGADEVQDQGYSGVGIKVACLDSGIDYTHAAFGGKGTVEAFEEAYLDNVNRDGLFPTEKVVGGIDFVGES